MVIVVWCNNTFQVCSTRICNIEAKSSSFVLKVTSSVLFYVSHCWFHILYLIEMGSFPDVIVNISTNLSINVN